MVSTCQSMPFARLSRLEMKDYAALVAAAATGASGSRAHASGSWQSACARHDQRAAAELRPMARSGDIWKERAPEGIGRVVRLLCRSGANFSRLLGLLSARLFLAAGLRFVGKCNGRGGQAVRPWPTQTQLILYLAVEMTMNQLCPAPQRRFHPKEIRDVGQRASACHSPAGSQKGV